MYITELISLAKHVCMEDKSSPHTLIQLLEHHRMEFMEELRYARSIGGNDKMIGQGWQRAVSIDLATIRKAIAIVKRKIVIRGF